MRVEKKTLKTVSLVAIALLVGSLAGYAIGSLRATLPETQHPFSYTVYREGNHYYARNAFGNIQFSGTNASQIINDAIGTGNATVLLKTGTYSISASILIQHSNTWLVGENREATILEASNDVDLILLQPQDRYVENIHISNLYLKGVGRAVARSGCGIHGDLQSWYCTFDNLLITDTYVGINFSSTAETRAARSLFQNVHIKYTNYIGIYFKQQDSHELIKIDVHETQYGIFFEQKVQGVRFEGVASDMNTETGITLKDCQALTGDDVFLSSNRDYGLFLDSCKHIKLTNLFIEYSNEANLVIGTTACPTFDVRIMNGEIYTGNKTGVQIVGSNNHNVSSVYLDHLLIHNNGLLAPSAYYGIHIGDTGNAGEGTRDIWISYCNIGNDFNLHSTRNQMGIKSTAQTDRVHISWTNTETAAGNNRMDLVGSNNHVNCCWNGTTWIP